MKNLKKTVCVVALFLFTQFTIAQTWQWSNHAGGSNYDVPFKICIDHNTNSYVAGRYNSDTCYFNTDSLTLLCQTLGCGCYYIAKYNSSGTELWVRGSDGTSQNNLYAGTPLITYDSINDYLYMLASFKGTGNIGGISLSTSNTVFNMLIAKFDTNGNCLWAKKAEANSGVWAGAIAIDGQGNIIVSGQAYSAATFDTITVAKGIFLAKYDSSGSCLWAKKKFNTNFNSFGFDAFLSQLKIRNGDIFALGGSSVDSFTVDTVTVRPNFQHDQYIIARFDSTGTAKWIKPCSGQSPAPGTGDIIVDNNNNSYISGFFSYTGIFENDTIINTHSHDLFFAKYNSSGHLIWVRQGNTSNYASGSGLTFTDNGFYLTGGFNGNITFGSNTLTSSTNGDLFVAKNDTSGSCLGALQVANSGGSSIGADGSGSIYVTGTFKNTATFGSNASMTSRGQSDIFIAKSTAITGFDDYRMKSNQLYIYANPNKGICDVTIPDDFQNEKNLMLNIYSSGGKLVQQVPVAMRQGKITLNIEAQAQGVYNVTLCNSSKCYNGRIVFE